MSMLSSMFKGSTSFHLFGGFTSKGKANKLREEIESLSDRVKTALKDAGIEDNQLLTLTREDLNEILPGVKNFQLRHKTMELINKAKEDSLSGEALANSLKDLIQKNDWDGDEVVLRNYLHALKNLEKPLTDALDFVKAHIKLLENLSGSLEMSSGSSTVIKKQRDSEIAQQPWTILPPPEPPRQRTLKVHLCQSGKTLGADKIVFRRLNHVESSSLELCDVILLFCTIVSRAGSDIQSAIQRVKEAGPNLCKPVILIMMHHTHDQTYSGINYMTASEEVTIVGRVNVLFHETLPNRLHECETNTKAIEQIQTALQPLMRVAS